MSLFKSNKNKSTSAASTPSQTPRTSMQGTRPSHANTMTREQAVENALEKCVHYSSMSYRMRAQMVLEYALFLTDQCRTVRLLDSYCAGEDAFQATQPLTFKVLTTKSNAQHIKMPLFKRSSKNQSSSAASTPAQTPSQTPRVSLEEQRPVQPTGKMTRDQALSAIMQNSMANGASRAFVC
ncbi:hypothetical protein BGX26_012571 [Mortierella sp. AD094]|nr:hypothetical protein BGX26_012571 [Mortierella sp. AD094]